MFSDRWHTSEPINIVGCSYEAFKEFLSYFYSGLGQFSMENIFEIIDLAEMYQVQPMKTHLDKFLAEVSFTDDIIFKLFEVLETYNFKVLEKSLKNYFDANYMKLLKREDFYSVNKATILGILKLAREKDEKVECLLFENVIYEYIHIC